MNTIFCTAIVNGTPVFVELTTAQLYGVGSDLVQVCVDLGTGEITVYDVRLESLSDLTPEVLESLPEPTSEVA